MYVLVNPTISVSGYLKYFWSPLEDLDIVALF